MTENGRKSMRVNATRRNDRTPHGRPALPCSITIHGLPAADGEPALMPFNVTHNSDMKVA